MRTLKKTLCLVLALVMVLGICAFNAGAAFTDQADITHAEAVGVLTGIGVIKGMGDDTFDPNGTLTRAQACVIITKLMGGDGISAKSTFKDCQGHWGESYIAFCAAKGVVVGKGDGTFGPDDLLTGSAWGKMLLVAMGFDAEKYGFEAGNTSWEIGVAKLIKDKKLAAGIVGFDGTQPISRDNACELAFQGMQTSATGDKVYTVTLANGRSYDFDDAIDAMLLYSANDDAELTVKADKDSLMAVNFPTLSGDADVDDFGRPCTVWTYGRNADVIAVAADAASHEFTVTSATAKTKNPITNAMPFADQAAIVNYLNKTALKLTGKAKVLQPMNEPEEEGEEATPKAFTLLVNGEAVAANALELKAGDVVSVYTDLSKNIKGIYIEHYELAQVQGITKLTATQIKNLADTVNKNATARVTYLTADGVNKTTYDTEFADFGYEKDEFFLAACDEYGYVLASKPTKTVSGEVTAKTAYTVTIGGVPYGFAAGTSFNLTQPGIGDEGEWALDATGSLGAVVTSTSKSSNYAYVYSIVSTAGTANEDGITGKDAYTVYAVLSDGTKASWPAATETVDEAVYVKGDKPVGGSYDSVLGVLNTEEGFTEMEDAAMVPYAIVNGKFTVAQGTMATATETTVGISSSNAKMTSGAVCNNSTVFNFVELTATGAVKVTTVTGYKAAKIADATTIEYAYNDITNSVAFAFIGAKNGNTSVVARTVAVLMSASATEAGKTDDTKTFTYSIIVDGEVTSLVLTPDQCTIFEALGLSAGDVFAYAMVGDELDVVVTGTEDAKTIIAPIQTVTYVNGTQLQLVGDDDEGDYDLGTIDIGSAKVFTIAEKKIPFASVSVDGVISAWDETVDESENPVYLDGNRVIIVDDGKTPATYTYVFIVATEVAD